MSAKSESELRLFYVPVPDQETGRMLARAALEASLAACGNLLGPMLSFYEWEGAQQEEQEYLLILKTTSEREPALRKLLMERHPYDCPCICGLDAEVNLDFRKWVESQV